MAKSKKELMVLQCPECKNALYTYRKSRGVIESKEKFLITKYCRHCRKHRELKVMQ